MLLPLDRYTKEKIDHALNKFVEFYDNNLKSHTDNCLRLVDSVEIFTLNKFIAIKLY